MKKSGNGLLSNAAGRLSAFGETSKYYLEKLGLGINDGNNILDGRGLRLGKGLYLGRIEVKVFSCLHKRGVGFF